MRTAIKLVLLIATSLIFQCASAQIFDKTKGKNIEKLYNQKTHVYTFGTGAYNERLTGAFNEHWKVTPFEMHDITNGVPGLEEDPAVFMPVVIGLVKKKDNRDIATSLNNPFYVFGAGYESGKFNANGVITAFPINGFHYEFDVTSDSGMYFGSMLRVPYIVRTCNDMLTHLKDKGDEKSFFESLEQKSTTIGKKTMLIPKELFQEVNVNPNATALMKGDLDAGRKKMKPLMAAVMDQSSIAFRGKYKIMSSADIMKLEGKEDADKYTLFLPAINHEKCIIVFDLKTKELLYYESEKMSMKIKEKDFEKLNKAAGL